MSSGEPHDDMSLPAQIDKLKQRFGVRTLITICDRGVVLKADPERIPSSERIDLIATEDGIGR